MSTGIDRKSYTRAHRAPQRGHGALLEPLAQLGDALSGVLALKISVEATELVIVQTARCGVAVSMGADRKANTWEAAAHSRVVIFVSLRMAASLVAPSALMRLLLTLRVRDRIGRVRQ